MNLHWDVLEKSKRYHCGFPKNVYAKHGENSVKRQNKKSHMRKPDLVIYLFIRINIYNEF